MRVLLIDPQGLQPGINSGLAYLAGTLQKSGIRTKIIDLNNYWMGFDGISNFIKEFKPQIIGCSIKTSTYFSATNLLKRIRNEFPNILLVAGGPHITLAPEDFLQENPYIDFIVSGEGEETFVKLCLSIFKHKDINRIRGVGYYDAGEIVLNQASYINNLDNLTFPNFKTYNFIDFKRFPYPLVTSRGCPYKCIYCAVSKISGSLWRYRTPENAIEELVYAKKAYGIEEFEIIDDVFTLNIQRAIKFSELLIRKRINLRWSCQNGIRADNVSKELANIMFKAGCHTVTFGVESGDSKVFNFINKGESLSQIERAVKIFKNAGIRVGGYFIIGLPYDNLKKTEQSLDFAKKIGLDWAHFNILSLYPGTYIWEWMRKNGKLIGDYREASHFGEKIKPTFETVNFSDKEMVKAYKMVHTRQLLFHLILPQNLSPVKKNIKKLFLIIQYNPYFIFNQLKIIIKRFPKLLIKIILYEIQKRVLKSFYYRDKGKRASIHNTKMKILYVNNIYDYTGGTEIYMINVSKRLVEMGHKIVIIYDKGRRLGIEKNYRFKLYKVSGISEYSAKNGEKTQKEFIRIIKKEKPDVIHLHNVYNPLTIKSAEKFAPVIRMMHDYYSICPALNKYLRGYNKICKHSFGIYCLLMLPWNHCVGADMEITMNRICDKIREVEANKRLKKILVASTYMKKELLKNGFLAGQVDILPYFSDLYIKRDRRDISYKEKLIIAVGRITLIDKGFEYLIDALPFLKGEYTVAIIGDGPAVNFLKQRVNQKGLHNKITFTGWLSRDRIIDYYSRCRVVVVPSMWAEPFGIVGIEAMYYAKPVVAFKVGGIPDWLINNKNGFLVTRGNIKELAKKIQFFLDNNDIAKKMGLVGKKIAEKKFSPDMSINKLLEIYKEVRL